MDAPTLTGTSSEGPREPRRVVRRSPVRKKIGVMPEHSFLRLLGDDAATELIAANIVRTYPRNHVITSDYARRGAVHLLLTGWVLESQLYNGGCQGTTLRGPGEILGDVAVFGQSVPTTSTCEGPVTAVVMPTARLAHFLESHPTASSAFTQSLTHRLQRTQQQYAAVARPSEERIAACIYDLAERWGEASPDGRIMIRGISQAHIAHVLVMSRASVENTLRLLRELGVLETGYRTIRVLNLPYLRKFAVNYEIALDDPQEETHLVPEQR